MMAARAGANGIKPVNEDSPAYTAGRATPPHIRVPPAVTWLGALGAIPFVCLAVAGHLLQGPLREQAFVALSAYGAVILSFLGGIHWGLAIAGFGPADSDSPSFRRLAFSVVPSLIGWAALFLPTAAGILLFAAAFALMLLIDFVASQRSEAPDWYPRLRLPLTLIVVASLAVSAIA